MLDDCCIRNYSGFPKTKSVMSGGDGVKRVQNLSLNSNHIDM